MARFDADAYFARIGYSGPAAASLDTLAELHLRHPAAIPFENLDPLLRRPVRLDPASLQQKLLRERRGGYCYEHNILFAGVLQAIGFQTTGLAARVLWNAPQDAVRPRSHMLLRVDIAGSAYLADVGFGGLTQTAPLRVDTDVEQPTAHEVFRITRAGSDFLMQARVKGVWRSLYRFGPEEHLTADYEVANWYTSTHPASHFLHSLMAARALPGKRLALLNNELAVHRLDGDTERRTLATAAELRATLQDAFGIALPEDPGLRPALERVAATRAGS